MMVRRIVQGENEMFIPLRRCWTVLTVSLTSNLQNLQFLIVDIYTYWVLKGRGGVLLLLKDAYM